MSERIRKTIYEIEYRAGGAEDLQQVNAALTRTEQTFEKTATAAKTAEASVDKTTQALKETAVESEKAGNRMTTLTDKVKKAGDAMGKLANVGKLKAVFDANADALAPFAQQIERLKRAMDNPESIDAVRNSLREFVASLPSDIQDAIGDKLFRQFDQLNEKLKTPAARL